MNLLALQYKDIGCALISAPVIEGSSAYTTRLEDGSTGDQYLVLDTKHSPSTVAASTPILKARPAFPNSLLSTQVLLSHPTNTPVNFSRKSVASSDNEAKKKIAKASAPPGKSATISDATSMASDHPDNVLDQPVSNSLYYRLHDPLPDELGSALYRGCAQVSGILENEPNLATLNTDQIHELLLLINAIDRQSDKPEQADIAFFLDDHASQPQAPQRLQVGFLSIELRTFSHLCHRLNVIGKSRLVVSDSAGIAVDAILSSVPVAFTGTTPDGFECVQASISHFMQHQDYERLREEQQIALNEILQTRGQHAYLLSNTRTLHALIQACLSQPSECIGSDSQTPVNSENPDGLILSSQQGLTINPDTSVRLFSGLEASRRKLRKFKESPARFMNDSQSRLLRSLANGKSLR